ncbi:hypothetical protein LIER_18980 [Lithospermum erythrorhizon]|uniref:BED-type domain-containing protein n=1 Tax=Lithospermum erythrorhizon TaxID=34254 RepID=A0AAV3QIN0_LITER
MAKHSDSIPRLPEGATMADYWDHDQSNELEDGVHSEDVSEVVSIPNKPSVKPLKRTHRKPPSKRLVKQVKTQPLRTKETNETDKTYSKLWAHFEKIKGTKRAMCLHCHKDYAADPREHSTSGLWNHNDRCPSAPWNKKIEKPKDQPGILDLCDKQNDGLCSIVGIKSKTLDIQLLRESLSKMHIVEELPFNFVEGEGFKEFVRVLEPRFILPRRDTVASDCFRLYDKEKFIMKKLLKDHRMCLTTDG